MPSIHDYQEQLRSLIQLNNLVQNQSKMKQVQLPELQSVNRITSLPIVETSWNYAEHMYQRIKHSNNVIQWTLDQAESSLYNMIDTASPAVFLFEGPLSTIDKLLCKSLDIVEQKVPSINLPPQMIYSNTKQYVSDVGNKLVRPVLKRADSVKQIGNQMLESKFTEFAADKLDGALDVADMYVDKYLPADVFDRGNESIDEVDMKSRGAPTVKAIQTSQHMFRFSKKLRRRLTRRTLLEAQALKHQSAEAIHVLVYVAELVATDPKLALQKGRELWANLSKDEPENQARPENLEQLIVLLTRETARRVVHLINFTANGIGKVPQRVANMLQLVTSSCFQLLDALVKSVHLDGVQQFVWHKAQPRIEVLKNLLKQLNLRTTDLLEQAAMILSADKKSSIPSANSKTRPAPLTNALNQLQPKVQEPNAVIENEINASLTDFSRTNANSDSIKEPTQDTLKLPTAAKTQLKATHRNTNNASPQNGESILKS